MQILQAVHYVISVLLFMAVVKALSNGLFPVTKPIVSGVAHTKNVKLALAWRNTGLYLGVAIALAAVFSGNNFHDTDRFLILPLNGAMISLFLVTAQFINDKFIVSRVNNSEAIGKGNVAVGVTEFGGFVATGLIAYGSFWGVNGSWLPAIAFFFVGQVFVVLFFRFFDWLHPVDFLGEICRGNTAAGTVVAGMLVSLGLVLKTAVAGDFAGWKVSSLGFLTYAGLGVVLLLVFYYLLAKVFFGKINQTKEINEGDTALALELAVGEVAIAVALSMVI